MQQKAAKHRRQRRAWAKPFSMPSHITHNRGVLGEYQERAKGLAINEAEIDDLIRRYYKHEPFSGTGPGRKEIAELLLELKHLVPAMLFFDIFPENCYQRVRMFFNSSKTCWIIVHNDFRRKTVRRSIEYPTKELALDRWHRSKVTWTARPIPNGG